MNKMTASFSEDIIRKIELHYLNQVIDPKIIEPLPRDVLLSSLTPAQQLYLRYLIAHQKSLFIEIEFQNVLTLQTRHFPVDCSKAYFSINSSLYTLKAIHFMPEPAVSWLQEYFQTEIEQLAQYFQPVSAKHWMYFALYLGVLSALLLLALDFEDAKAWEFAVFTVGVLAFGYVWESIKALKRRRKHLNKYDLIKTGLVQALFEFSQEILLLDHRPTSS